MRRVMYVFLPRWPIDRLRRSGAVRSLCSAPAEELPFATVTASGGRRLLAALNQAAEKAGLSPGMPLPDALSFLPGLMTASADPAADTAALTCLAEWCGRYSPWTAPDDSHGIKIEITGSAHLWGGENALAANLSRRLTREGVAHRIAIAATLGAAWALARYAARDGEPALPAPKDEYASLAPLPVEALRLDPATAQGLRRVGLRHIGELCPMPRDALARRFGDAVTRRLDQAFGDLSEPLSPLGETPSWRVRLSFAEPIADPADLARAIERLIADLVARLTREGMGARLLALGFHRVDGRVEHIRIGTARPSRDPRHLAKLFAEKLTAVDPGLGVEDMILAVFAAEKLEPEQSEFVASGETAPQNIAFLIDRLVNRFGLSSISRIVSHASHLPERASIFVPVNQETTRKDSDPGRINIPFLPRGALQKNRHRGGAQEPIPHPSGENRGLTKIPRPVRLFRPPESIEAQWVLPDDPPFRFHWRRVWHRVIRAEGPERIAEEWWLEGRPVNREAGEAIRDYYRVEDEEGCRFWLYRAGLLGDPPPRWFVHGIFA